MRCRVALGRPLAMSGLLEGIYSCCREWMEAGPRSAGWKLIRIRQNACRNIGRRNVRHGLDLGARVLGPGAALWEHMLTPSF